MNASNLRRYSTTGIALLIALTGMLGDLGAPQAAGQTTMSSGGGARPAQPIYVPPGTPQPVPPIALPPGAVKPQPPIYPPPGIVRPGHSGWVNSSQQFGLPCAGSTSIIAGTIYYVCGTRYFIEQPGPNGATFAEVPAPQ